MSLWQQNVCTAIFLGGYLEVHSWVLPISSPKLDVDYIAIWPPHFDSTMGLQLAEILAGFTYLWLARNEGMDAYSSHCITPQYHSSFHSLFHSLIFFAKSVERDFIFGLNTASGSKGLGLRG